LASPGGGVKAGPAKESVTGRPGSRAAGQIPEQARGCSSIRVRTTPRSTAPDCHLHSPNKMCWVRQLTATTSTWTSLDQWAPMTWGEGEIAGYRLSPQPLTAQLFKHGAAEKARICPSILLHRSWNSPCSTETRLAR